MPAPNTYTLSELTEISQSVSVEAEPGVWVPARPMGKFSFINRVKCAWLVFSGRADAVIWPSDLNKE